MATQLIIYKKDDKAIIAAVKKNDGSDYVWLNEATYATDDYINIDGVKRVYGLNLDNYDIIDFTGSIPEDLEEKLFGNFTDPENIIYPMPYYYKFNTDFTAIEQNS